MPLVCFTLILSLFPHGSASPISYDNTSPATVNAPKCCWSAYGDKSTCGGYPTGGSGGLCNNDFLVKCNGDANCKNVPPAPPPSPAPTPAPPKPAPPTPPALGPPSPPTPPAPPSPGDALCCWSAWTKPNAQDCATCPCKKGGWCKRNFIVDSVKRRPPSLLNSTTLKCTANRLVGVVPSVNGWRAENHPGLGQHTP